MARVKTLSPAEVKRRSLGLSYEKIAQKADKPASTVRYYLQADGIKSVEIAKDIAKALDSSIDIFLPRNYQYWCKDVKYLQTKNTLSN